MVKDDLNILKRLKRDIKKHPQFRFFLADKRGSNAEGLGAKRSVILARHKTDGPWIQFGKVWGYDNVNRAKEIVRQALIKDDKSYGKYKQQFRIFHIGKDMQSQQHERS